MCLGTVLISLLVVEGLQLQHCDNTLKNRTHPIDLFVAQEFVNCGAGGFSRRTWLTYRTAINAAFLSTPPFG
jgi:hypothetical protein